MSHRYHIEDLKRVMERLRDPKTGCPWDVGQTYETIVPHTLEECLELIDAIENSDFEHVEEELGDLLFQVIFYSQLGDEDRHFDFDSVVSRVTEKLLKRHPHVFKDGQIEGFIEDRASMIAIKSNWEAAKAAERAARSQESVMDDVPNAFSALVRSQKLQRRAAPLGYDFDNADEVVEQVAKELAELSDSRALGDAKEIENELGDVLFTVVNLARHCQVDAEAALRKANRRFERRVRFAERAAIADGSRLQEETRERLSQRWEKAKNEERKDDL